MPACGRGGASVPSATRGSRSAGGGAVFVPPPAGGTWRRGRGGPGSHAMGGAGSAAMRKAGEQVIADIVEAADVVSCAVGLMHRGRLVPIIIGGVGLDNLRTSPALLAAAQPRVGLAGDRIRQLLLGERELEF